jgi:hypothetical protein
MDPAYISTLAALTGSAIGALASFATTWTTQDSQARAARRAQERAHREALHGVFIQEESRLFVLLRTTITLSAQSKAAATRNMSFSQAGHTLEPTLCPNISVGSSSAPSLITITSISPTGRQ